MTCLRSPEGDPQLVFYDPGIGTEGGYTERMWSGATGAGIDLNIQQLYTSLATNYEDGDNIYLFGFSRGAYTVRSLAGMINEAGLVHRDKLDMVKEAYDLYRTNGNPDNDTAKTFRSNNSRRVPIKLLACFDTVGSLGLPVDAIPLGRFFIDTKKYAFHDIKVGVQIEHAIHIMSIDEERKGFFPTFMAPNPARGDKQLTQIFMPGRHSGVGGGDPAEQDFSDNALRFMISEMKRRDLQIALREDMIPEEKDPFCVMADPGFLYKTLTVLGGGRKCRDIPSVDILHESAFRRYCKVPEWRPEALQKFKSVRSFIANVEHFVTGNEKPFA